MAEYVQLGAVRTWYDEHGDGDPLVLLHGGLVDARWFEPNLAPPSWLSYTFRWDEPTPDDRETVVELTVDDLGGGALLSLWQGEFATGERLVLHRHGWTDSLDKLSTLLGARA